jgi:hypothetical protein
MAGARRRRRSAAAEDGKAEHFNGIESEDVKQITMWNAYM